MTSSPPAGGGHGLDDPAVEKAMLFAFEQISEDHFRAAPIPSSLRRLYGGQVMGQAVAAIQRTVPDETRIHSCHAYFIRPGDVMLPLEFKVSRDRDGRSFASRRVEVLQAGQAILTLAGSFHVPEDGPDYRCTMPDVPPPEGLKTMAEAIAEAGDRLPEWHRPFWRREQIIDWVPVEPFSLFDDAPMPAHRHFWIRLKYPLGDDPNEHLRYFAYASDLNILYTGLRPLGLGWARENIQAASLDHAIWFHDRFRVDEWLLYEMDSPILSGARSFGRGKVFTRDGRLVASVAQEGLLRMKHD